MYEKNHIINDFIHLYILIYSLINLPELRETMSTMSREMMKVSLDKYFTTILLHISFGCIDTYFFLVYLKFTNIEY